MAEKSFFAKVCLFLMVLASGCALHRGIFGSSETPHTIKRPASTAETRLRSEIASFARKQMGARYKYGGKSPKGFDCSGYTTYVLRQFDIPVSGPSYSQERLGKKTNKENAKPGDLVFFRKNRTGKVFHVAMVYDNQRGDLTLIHATSSRGVVMDKLSESSYWRSKVMTVRDVISDQ